MDSANIISATERRLHFNIAAAPTATPSSSQRLRGSLRMPFSSGLNQHVDAVRVQNLDWSISLGLVPDDDFALLNALERCQFEQLAALVHRDCSFEALALIANLYTSIFVLDDMLDDERSMIGCSVELAEHVAEYLSAAVADEPRPRLRADVPSYEVIVAVGDAFVDLAERLMAFAGREGLDRYVDGMRLYLRGCVMESHRRTDRVTRLADYINVRLQISAVYACLDCGAIAEDVRVPDAIWNDPAFDRMRAACNLCVSYVNDIFSYAKESSAGEVSNIVTVNRMVYGMSLPEALVASSDANDDVVQDYVVAKHEIQSRHHIDASTHRYIRMMENWMRGNFDWYSQDRTERYTDYLTTAIPA